MGKTSQSILLAGLGYSSASTKKELLGPVSAQQWSEVAKLAHRQRFMPLLYHNLKALNLNLPEEVAVLLKEQYLKQAFRNAQLFYELGKILQLLNDKDIPVIVLKGAYLAGAVYDNIGLRGMSDVDLLVKKDDLSRVEEELLLLKAAPEQKNRLIAQHCPEFTYKTAQFGLRLDIHWALNPSKYDCLAEVDGLWSRSKPVTLQQFPARTLCPEDLLLHLCMHTAKHAHYMEFRMLTDIAEVIRYYALELDWAVVAERAREWGITRAAYIFLSLTKEFLAVDLSEEQLNKLFPEQFDESKMDLVRQQFSNAGVQENHFSQSQPVAQLWGIKGLAGKIAFIRERFPVSQEIKFQHNASVHPWKIYLYYPIRLKYIIKKHGAAMWSLLRGDKESRAAAEFTNEVNDLRDWLMSG